MKKSIVFSVMCLFVCSTAYAFNAVDCNEPERSYSFGGPTMIEMYRLQCNHKNDQDEYYNEENPYYDDEYAEILSYSYNQENEPYEQDGYYQDDGYGQDNYYQDDSYGQDDYYQDDEETYNFDGIIDDYDPEREEYYRDKRDWANKTANTVINDLIQRHMSGTLEYGIYLSPQLMDDITNNMYRHQSRFNQCLSNRIYDDSSNVNNFIEGGYDVALRLSGYVRRCWLNTRR
jgi:hypothetical protein